MSEMLIATLVFIMVTTAAMAGPAILQAKADPRSIIVLRHESRAGHGGGKPIAKVLDEAADGYAFLGKVFNIDFSRP